MKVNRPGHRSPSAIIWMLFGANFGKVPFRIVCGNRPGQTTTKKKPALWEKVNVSVRKALYPV